MTDIPIEAGVATPDDDGASASITEPDIDLLPRPVFYKLDSSRSSFRELWWDARSPAVLVLWLTKVLRMPLPGSINDPNVETLAPFETGETSLPAEVRDRIAPLVQELSERGFGSPCYLAIVDLVQASRAYVAFARHSSGQACARIQLRYDGTGNPPKTHVYCDVLSELSDGRFVWSTSAKAASLTLKSCVLNWQIGATASQLWTSHQQAVKQATAGSSTIVPMRDDNEMLAMLERHHAAVRDFHLARGVFKPMSPADQQRAEALQQNVQVAQAGGFAYPAVLAELHKLQNAQSKWSSTLLILAISLALFVMIAPVKGDWEFMLLLVPILFVHELGHYLAMRVFKYRNLRMFFIPMLGAAVSGQHYNVAGWKKVIVYLMGPLPGVFLAVVLGLLGLVLQHPLMIKAAMLTIILNGFNLLPVLPLDGGRVMHAMFFTRHHLLDVAFRAVAALALLAGGAALGDGFLTALGIFTAISLPSSYRLARIATELRRANLKPVSADDQTIPLDVAQVIIERVKGAFSKKLGNKAAAQHTLHVFETLNARPPGWLATTGFSVLYVATLVVAIAFGLLFTAGQDGNIRRVLMAAAQSQELPRQLDPGQIRTWANTALPLAATGPAARRSTIVATWNDNEGVEKAYAQLQVNLPRGVVLRVFGQSLFVAVPADDAALLDRLFTELEKSTDLVFVAGKNSGGIRLSCVAPDDAAATAIVEEVRQYGMLAADARLIPPWIPDESGLMAEWPRWQASRKAFQSLRQVEYAYDDGDEPADKVADDLFEQATKWQRRGQQEKADELFKQHRQHIEARAQQRLREAAAAFDGTPQAAVAEKFLAFSSGEAPADSEKTLERYKQFNADLAPLLGQLPADDAEGNWSRYSLEGSAFNIGPTVSFYHIQFDDVFDGAPALVRWLQSRGCHTFRYDTLGPRAIEDYFDE